MRWSPIPPTNTTIVTDFWTKAKMWLFLCSLVFSGQRLPYMIKPSSVTKRNIMVGMVKCLGMVYTPHQCWYSDRKFPYWEKGPKVLMGLSVTWNLNPTNLVCLPRLTAAVELGPPPPPAAPTMQSLFTGLVFALLLITAAYFGDAQTSTSATIGEPALFSEMRIETHIIWWHGDPDVPIILQSQIHIDVVKKVLPHARRIIITITDGGSTAPVNCLYQTDEKTI